MRGMLIVLTVLVPGMAIAGWIRTYEINELSIGHSVRQTSDGGYIIAGQCGDENQCDVLLIKTDSLGDTMWTRVYGGSYSDLATCVQQTNDGGYIVSGHLSVYQWLLKIKPNGDTLWTRTYGYGGANWVEQTTDGGFILTGRIEDAYMWILKTNKDGDTLWSKWYQWGWVNEVGNCIRQTRDGGYIVATNMGLLKTDENGDSIWMKPWGGRCVQQTSDEGYVLTAHAGPGQGDLWIGKTDADGDSLWVRLYGGGEEEEGYCVEQTSDGGYIIVGETRSFGQGNYDVWLIKTDANGDTLWTRTYGWERVDQAYSVQQTTDGGYVLTGNTTMFSGDWRPDVLLIKTDSLGYVGVEEPVPVTHPVTRRDWEVVTSVGQTITLRYMNHPQGFHAIVYDATGRKVDELSSTSQSGTITWPVTPSANCQSGVYFVREESTRPTIQKVILIR
jgi:hypothetical protein